MSLHRQGLCVLRLLSSRQFGVNLLLSISNEARDAIDNTVHQNKVVVFMKGTPEHPLCGFSNAVAQILKLHGVEYHSCNVLENEDLRQGIKEYSNWLTIPQVYIGGEFVGGCDILLKMHQNGELVEELKKSK